MPGTRSFGFFLLVLMATAFAKTSVAQDVSAAEFAEWASRNNYQAGRDWRSYLTIAPGNMGPNALPIAPGNFGYTDSLASFSVSGNSHWRVGDHTQDVQLEIAYPFGRRTSLRVRYLLREWYDVSENLALNRNSLASPGKGNIDGDVHVEGLFKVIQEHMRRPAVTLAVRVKTASGSGLEALRYTDSPGYQFDVTFARNFKLNPQWSVRPFASGGFFVWQRFGRGSPQNDAYTYSLGARLQGKRLRAALGVAGYSGWTEVLDRPVQVRGSVHWLSRTGRFVWQLRLEHGLRDIEYTTAGVGFAIRWGNI